MPVTYTAAGYQAVVIPAFLVMLLTDMYAVVQVVHSRLTAHVIKLVTRPAPATPDALPVTAIRLPINVAAQPVLLKPTVRVVSPVTQPVTATPDALQTIV